MNSSRVLQSLIKYNKQVVNGVWYKQQRYYESQVQQYQRINEVALEEESAGISKILGRDYELAIDHLQRAYDLRELIEEPISDNLYRKIYVLQKLGVAYSKIGDKQVALKILQRQVDLEFNFRIHSDWGYNRIHGARSLNEVARLHIELNNINEATECLNKSLMIAESAYLQDYQLNAEINYNQGILQIKQGNVQLGLTFLENGLNELKKCPKNQQFPLILDFLQTLLECHHQNNNLEKAEEIAYEHILCAKDYYGLNKIETVIIMLNHLEIQIQLGILVQAQENSQEILDILKELFPQENHPLFAVCYLQLNYALEQLEEFDQQQQVLNKLFKVIINLQDNCTYSMPSSLTQFIQETAMKYQDIGNQQMKEIFLQKIQSQNSYVKSEI